MSLSSACRTTFPTEMGWCAMIVDRGVVLRLSIGHADATAARDSLPQTALASSRAVSSASLPLVARLQAFSAGADDDFLDVPVAVDHLGPFQRQVVERCREIPYGGTITYGQLARLAGSPRAARAVGNTMAGNRVPLIIPCHRVIPAGGGWGGFSAPQGTRLKRRLLRRESVVCRADSVLRNSPR